jgi:hypothetical protein
MMGSFIGRCVSRITLLLLGMALGFLVIPQFWATAQPSQDSLTTDIQGMYDEFGHLVEPQPETTVSGTSQMPEVVDLGSEELARPTYAELRDYCSNFLKAERKCPNDICMVGCEGGVIKAGCQVICEPRPCFELSAGDCPTDQCQVLQGCSGQPVCYTKDSDGPPACGDLAYPGQDVPCCEGMVQRCGIEFFDRTCDMVGHMSIYSVPICLPCGNGICNQFENHCNCPEDCP